MNIRSVRNKTNSKISIIIPCYNEEGNIKPLYEKIKNSLQGLFIEIIFLDDHSFDKTLTVIEELAKNDTVVKYISFSRNFGHQNSLRAGMEYSTGECVICMDSDLQHPPEILPSLIDKWIDGYDIVYTKRIDGEGTSSLKKMTSSLFYRIINALSEIKFQPGTADFRLVDRGIVDILIKEFSEYHLFYRGLINWVGYKQIGIDYIANRRFSGEPKYSYRKMVTFAINGITSFSIKPLKLATLLGLSISLIALFYAMYALAMSIFTDKTVTGWTSVIISVLLLGGINMVLLGIIGEYLGKLYIQGKKRPYYLIEKTNLQL